MPLVVVLPRMRRKTYQPPTEDRGIDFVLRNCSFMIKSVFKTAMNRDMLISRPLQFFIIDDDDSSKVNS